MYGWMDECTDGKVNELMDVQYEWLYEWMDE